MLAATILALASAQTALAHGGVLSYSWSGQWYWGWSPYNTPTGQTTIQRPWSSYNPIQDATDATISCNDNGASGALQLTGTVTAGTAITAYWNQVWPHNIGPMLTYMALCPGSTCTGVNSDSLSWFKIDQSGLLSGTVYSGNWGDGQMIAQNSSWTSTVPSCIPAGNYLIRFETIALHSLPAQFYPECAQLNVVGGGSTTPSGSYLVKFPGAYSNTDPGIDLDVYSVAAQSQTTYPIPGPPLFTCSGGSSPPPKTTTSAAKPATTTTAKAGTTTTPKTTSTPPKTTSTPVTGTVAHYGQCGGTGWTGGTTCVSPYTCTYSSAYYSQCL